MKIKSILCRFVFPEIEWFMKTCIYAVSRCPVKIKAYMQTMLLSHKYQFVNLIYNFIIYLIYIIDYNIL